jgi:hypothetical protein
MVTLDQEKIKIKNLPMLWWIAAVLIRLRASFANLQTLLRHPERNSIVEGCSPQISY